MAMFGAQYLTAEAQTRRLFCCSSTIGGPSTDWEFNPKDFLVDTGFKPLSLPIMFSRGYCGLDQELPPSAPIGSYACETITNTILGLLGVKIE